MIAESTTFSEKTRGLLEEYLNQTHSNFWKFKDMEINYTLDCKTISSSARELLKTQSLQFRGANST